MFMTSKQGMCSYSYQRTMVMFADQGPVVQSIVSLTTSLSGHLVKYIPTTLSNTLLFFVEKNVRIFCTAKDAHIFPTKNNSGFLIFTF